LLLGGVEGSCGWVVNKRRGLPPRLGAPPVSRNRTPWLVNGFIMNIQVTKIASQSCPLYK